MILSFTVPGPPAPNERHRKGMHGNMYTPKGTVEYRKTAAWAALEATRRMPMFPLDGDVRTEMMIYFPGSKGDGDNVEKTLHDAWERILYRNDRQVRGNKWVREFNQAEPRVDVKLYTGEDAL